MMVRVFYYTIAALFGVGRSVLVASKFHKLVLSGGPPVSFGWL